MWHILTLEIQGQNAKLFGIMGRTRILNPVATSDVLKSDKVFRGIVCEINTSAAVPCDTGQD